MSKRSFRQRAKSSSFGFSPEVILHPWGEKWLKDQQRSAERREDFERSVDLTPEPTPIIPGVSEPRQWAPALPEAGVVDEHGAVIRQIVDGRWSNETVPGFPAHLNRPCATAEEVEALRLERLEWANANLVRVATKRTGRDDLNVRPARGALEQCYGLLGLDVTLAWRFAAKAGLDVEKRLERCTKYGGALLRRVFGVAVLAEYFHPANPFEHEARGGFGGGEWEELGFGSHVQFMTGRTLGGAWLTKERDFRRVGPATVSGMHLMRLGVDVHAHARARFESDQTWLYAESTAADWARQKLKEATVRRIQFVQAAVAAGKTTVEAAVAEDLSRWDASWDKTKKRMPDTLRRNLATASENQPPVDWTLSDRITRREIRELLSDPVWKPFLEKAQRAARDIETSSFKNGFKKSLSQLLFEWERADEAEGVRLREAAIKATAAKEIGTARETASAMVDKQAAVLKRASSDMKAQLAKKEAEAASLRAKAADNLAKVVRLSRLHLKELLRAAKWLLATQRPGFNDVEPPVEINDYVAESSAAAWGWGPTQEYTDSYVDVLDHLAPEETGLLRRTYEKFLQYSDSGLVIEGNRWSMPELVEALERHVAGNASGRDEFLLEAQFGAVRNDVLRRLKFFSEHPKSEIADNAREALRLAKAHEERRTEIGKKQVRDEFKRPPEEGDEWKA